MKKIFFIAILAIFMMGCETTVTTRSVVQPVQNNIEQKNITDAVTYVLIENGFELKLINESYGLITTEWREINNSGDTFINILEIFTTMEDESYTSYSRKMMLQVKINESDFKVTPKVAVISKTRNEFSVDESKNIEYPKSDTPEGKITNKIIEEINELLKIENSYIWEEKELIVK